MREFSNLKEINKDTFLTFKKVRDLQNPLYGQYHFYAKHGHKYMAKVMQKQYTFFSYRNPHHHMLRYHMQEQDIYLFSVNGQPINNFVQKINSEGEWKQWVQKLGSVQDCLWEVARFLLRLIEEKGLQEIILDCLRVHNGQLEYCYDTWMRSSQSIVLEQHNQLEDYFFSPSDLQEIESLIDQPSCWSTKIFLGSKPSLYFRVFMLILQLGTSNLNYRNYEHASYQHKRQHLLARLEYFCSRYNKKGLGDLTRKVIEGKNYEMQELWKIITPELNTKNNSRCLSIASSKVVKTTANVKLKKNKQNISNGKRMNSSVVSNISEENDMIKLERSVLGKKDSNVLTETKSGSVDKSRNRSHNQSCMLKSTNKAKTYNLYGPVQQFSLKAALLKSKAIPSSCMKLLKYLELQQTIPQTTLQQKLLSTLENVHITQYWVKQLYENGSIYLGQMKKKKKEGKGLYLFNSNDVYYGDWLQNSMNGYGIYIFAWGQMYEGQIRKGCKEGHGKCIYEDGRQYEGMWRQNCKIGLGKVKFPNQVIFIGVFNPSQTQTEGLFLGPLDSDQQPLWENKGILEQYNWQQNQIMENKTKQQIDLQKKNRLKTCVSEYYTEEATEGASYSGEMIDGLKHGYGIYQTSAERYQGQWIRNRRQGKGTLLIKNEFTISGIWKDNMLVEYTPSEDSYLL